MNGRKDDSNKPRFNLIPPLAEREVARVLEFGARKYAPDNWRKVPDARSRYVDAALRHINAHRSGEALDTGEGGSGLSHLAHAITSLMFALELELEPPTHDEPAPCEPSAYEAMRAQLAANLPKNEAELAACDFSQLVFSFRGYPGLFFMRGSKLMAGTMAHHIDGSDILPLAMAGKFHFGTLKPTQSEEHHSFVRRDGKLGARGSTDRYFNPDLEYMRLTIRGEDELFEFDPLP